MQVANPILLNYELCYKIAGASAIRKQVACLLHLKALFPDGRFNSSKGHLQTIATQLGYKCVETLIRARLVPLEHVGLIKCDGQTVFLATWQQIRAYFSISGKSYEKIYLKPDQNLEAAIMAMYIIEQKRRFQQAQDFNVKKDSFLREQILSVCSTTNRDAVAYCQRNLFCNPEEGTFDNEAEWLLLYARKKSGRFYYKADTEISVQHLSKLLGYAGKNGFCYWKKKAVEQGFLQQIRREYTIRKGIRTDKTYRSTSIGTFFFDHSTNTQKLRMVDKLLFIKSVAPDSLPGVAEKMPTMAA